MLKSTRAPVTLSSVVPALTLPTANSPFIPVAVPKIDTPNGENLTLLTRAVPESASHFAAAKCTVAPPILVNKCTK